MLTLNTHLCTMLVTLSKHLYAYLSSLHQLLFFLSFSLCFVRYVESILKIQLKGHGSLGFGGESQVTRCFGKDLMYLVLFSMVTH